MRLSILAATSALILSAAAFGTSYRAFAADSSTAIHMEADGSMTKDDADQAASKKFDSMDAEHTGKIDKAHHSAMFEAIHEMTKTDVGLEMDKKEYMAGVDAAFQEADSNHDGKLSSDELKSPAGKRFLMLVE